ncbi:MAG TPA: hypothetical protein VFE91_00565 [Nitrososphaerales archaeon]|nr:hypothetical protein [Nitrososphaerales archaeon]
MSADEQGPKIIEAHQELVRHVEGGARRIRALSLVTIAVSVLLVASYGLQLVLPLTGTTSVTVSLTDPGTVVAELVVVALVLVWLYVGVRDYRFSTRLQRDILTARDQEVALRGRVLDTTPDS